MTQKFKDTLTHYGVLALIVACLILALEDIQNHFPQDLNWLMLLFSLHCLVLAYLAGCLVTWRRSMKAGERAMKQAEDELKERQAEENNLVVLTQQGVTAIEAIRKYLEEADHKKVIDDAVRLYFRIVNAFYQGSSITIYIEHTDGSTEEFDPIESVAPGYAEGDHEHESAQEQDEDEEDDDKDEDWKKEPPHLDPVLLGRLPALQCRVFCFYAQVFPSFHHEFIFLTFGKNARMTSYK